MIEITLLDGAKLTFADYPDGQEIANKISLSLGQKSYVIYVDGELYDLKRKITKNAKIEIVTDKNKDVLLPIVRHSMAHLLGEAIMELFPDSKLAAGPFTEHGFFYDSLPKRPFNDEDLAAIELRMKEIVDRAEEIKRSEMTKSQALEFYKNLKQDFKVAMLEEIQEEKVSFYQQGNFIDMCRGPHVENTKKLPKSFKLTKVSGVYWQGDAEKPMLQRIYAVGFMNDKDLHNHLTLQEELEKNDHRKLGRELDLFHIQEEAVGSIFWHHKGWRLYRTLENYIREKIENHGYLEVKTPHILDKSLWEASGHWEKFAEDMFVLKSSDNATLALKPMNCPCHVELFKQGIKSYRDLPYRIAEFGSCHRNESSGSLHGTLRVRAFVQDDAHIFCTEEQIVSETVAFCTLLKEVYREIFGDINIVVKFSDRPQKRAGSDSIWDKSEKALWDAAIKAGLDPILSKGEGAFYGPKLEFTIKDSLGRDWQLGTLQSDFVLPQRLGACYIAEDGNKHIPVMLHRAILGSLERFIGVLLEHYKGKLPLWLAPLQVVIMTVSNKFDNYAQHVTDAFKNKGVYVELDNRYQKISYKIREHTLAKVPLMIIIGEKEQADNSLTFRILSQEEQLTLSLENALDFVTTLIKNKALTIKY